MNSKDAVNGPVRVSIGDRKYKIREVGFLRIMSIVSNRIIEVKMERIKFGASLLDGEAKSKYVSDKMDALPEGSELDKIAVDYLSKGKADREVMVRILFEAIECDLKNWDEEALAQLVIQNPEDIEMALTVALGTAKKGSAPVAKKSKR